MDTIRRVYVGDTALVSSLGVGVEEHLSAIEAGQTNLTHYGDGTPVCAVDYERVAKVEGFSRVERLAAMALGEVLRRSGVSLGDERTRLIISTTKGNVDRIGNDLANSYLWVTAERLATHFGAAERPLILSNACISGVAAVVVGARMIESGAYDRVAVVGVDVLSDFVVSGFNSFKSISPSVCRPYDLHRDGLTLGEGCGALLLTARREESPSKTVVAGGGLTNDANHISGPSRTGDGLALAMQAAMRQAGVTPAQIGFVNLHGTATAYNDEMESKAMRLAGLDGCPCNSLKPYLGHTLGASGVIEIILAVEQLRQNRIFGVKGYAECGVPVPLNVTACHRSSPMTACLKTASGFGGTNGAVVLAKEEACAEQKATAERIVRERAAVRIAPVAGKSFAEHIREEYRALGEPNLKFGKMDNLSKLGYVAASQLLAQMPLDADIDHTRIGIILSNRSASLDSDLRHQAQLDQHLTEGTSPAVFVYTLANIVAAEIAIRHKFQGETTFFVRRNCDEGAFEEQYARSLIASGRLDAVVCGWCELLGEEYEANLKLITK